MVEQHRSWVGLPGCHSLPSGLEPVAERHRLLAGERQLIQPVMDRIWLVKAWRISIRL
jgi:hypothetical protein